MSREVTAGIVHPLRRTPLPPRSVRGEKMQLKDNADPLVLIPITLGSTGVVLLYGFTWLHVSLIVSTCIYALYRKKLGEGQYAWEAAGIRFVQANLPASFRRYVGVDESSWFELGDTFQASIGAVVVSNIILFCLQDRYTEAVFTIMMVFPVLLPDDPARYREKLLFLLRASLGVEAIVLMNREPQFMHLKWFLVVRTFYGMMLYESQLDAAMNIMFLCVLVGWKTQQIGIILMAATVCLTVLLPLGVLPIRVLISTGFTSPIGTPLKKHLQAALGWQIFATLIPSLAMATIFSGKPTDRALELSYLLLGLGLASTGVAIASLQLCATCSLSDNKFNSIKFAPSSHLLIAPLIVSKNGQPVSEGIPLISVENIPLSWCLTLLTICLLCDSPATFGLPVLLAYVFTSKTDHKPISLCHGILNFIFSSQSPWIVVGLSACWLPIAFQDKLIMLQCPECFILPGQSVLLLTWYSHRDAAFCSAVTIVACLLTKLQTWLAEKSTQRVLETELDSDSFLQHAIKQKYAAIGNAIGTIINRNGQRKNSFSDFDDDELGPILSSVVAESKRGHDDCHFLNIVRLIRCGRSVRRKPVYRTLHLAVQTWIEEFEFVLMPSHHLPKNRLAESTKCTLDWDILRLIVSKFQAREGDTPTEISWSARGTSAHTFELELCLTGTTSTVYNMCSSIHFVISTLGLGKFSFKHEDTGGERKGWNGVLLFTGMVSSESNGRYDSPPPPITKEQQRKLDPDTAPFDKPLQSQVSMTTEPDIDLRSSSPSPIASAASTFHAVPTLRHQRNNSSVSYSLPVNLKFAILDDVSLIRRVLLQTIRVQCSASPDSYTRGANKKEALNFAQETMQTQPDIVIIDQNLSFDDGEDEVDSGKEESSTTPTCIYGLQIVHELRMLGYDGCVVVHSAENPSDFEYVSEIDGFLEKKVHVGGGISSMLAMAWERRLNRTKLNKLLNKH